MLKIRSRPRLEPDSDYHDLERTVKMDMFEWKKCRPQGGPPTAGPAERGAVGKEEHGSGWMAPFFLGYKKTSEQSPLCSDVVPVVGLEPAIIVEFSL